MGLVSCSSLARRISLVASRPVASATATRSSSVWGKNSCSGGSSSRMVTGSPSMIVNSSTKSARCIGRIFSSAARRPFSSSARIISRTAAIRSSSKNMCSVRQRPMPSAPNWRAVRASRGVSALARTFRRRLLSAHSIRVAKSPVSSGSIMVTAPARTSPLDPSMVMISPALKVRPRTRSSPALPSICSSPAPETQGRPMPRATTAAWLVMPPRAVTMPRAACMPWMSSGEVSSRTRMTDSPAEPRRSASSELNTILPVAAPGEAGRPEVITSRGLAGSIVGCSSWSRLAGSTRMTASSLVIRPSLARSTATFSAALAVRFPLRVWSM